MREGVPTQEECFGGIDLHFFLRMSLVDVAANPRPLFVVHEKFQYLLIRFTHRLMQGKKKWK